MGVGSRVQLVAGGEGQRPGVGIGGGVSVSPGGLGKAWKEKDSVSRAMRATGTLIDPID